MRQKKNVKSLLEPLGARLCAHVSAMYGKDRFNVAPVVSITRHPSNSNAIVVADLGEDIECLLDWSEDEIRTKLFVPRGETRAPLREVKVNRSPFIAPFEVLTDENIEKLSLSKKSLRSAGDASISLRCRKRSVVRSCKTVCPKKRRRCSTLWSLPAGRR